MKIALKNVLFKKSIVVLFIKVTGILLQFIAVFIITNNAEEGIFGKFNFMSSALILLGAICLLGMNNSFLQFSGKLQAKGTFNQVSSLYKRMLIILLGAFFLVVSIYGILTYFFEIAYFVDEERRIILLKIILALLPYSISLLNFQVIRGLDMLYISELSSNILRFGSLFALCLFLYFSNDFSFLLAGYTITFYAISLITTLVVVKKLFRLKKIELKSKISYSEILRVSFPMSFSLISLLMMQSFDIFILEKYWTYETVGFYGAAVKITTGIGIILATINAIIAPDISRLFFSNDFDNLKKLIIKSTMLNFYLTLPVILGIYFFSDYILLLFGDEYVKAKTALLVMIIAQMFNAFCGSVGVYLNMTGKQKQYLIILSMALFVNIILNLILIPEKGMVGAAVATGISLILWNLIGVIYIYRKDKIGVFVFSKYIR